MNSHEERAEIFQKFAKQIKTIYPIYIGEKIPGNLLSNAINKYAPDVDKKTVIGLLDSSILGNGKSGALFTDERLYLTQPIGKPERIHYSDINRFHPGKGNTVILLNDFTTVDCYTIEKDNIEVLNSFVKEIQDYNNSLKERKKKEIFEKLKATTAKLENSSQEPTEDMINDTAQAVNINIDEIKETINDVDELLDIMDCITEGKQIKKPVNYRAKNQNPEMSKIIETYFPQIEKKSQTYCSYYSGKNIPKKMLDKVASKIDRSIDIDTVIGIIDTTPLDSGKTGYVFTNDKLYSKDTFEKTKITRYWNIKEITILDDGKNDSRRSLNIKSITGDNLKITDGSIAKTPFKACLNELVRSSKKL